MSLLGWLTLATAVAVVLVLAGYLIAILVALEGARRNLARLAEGLAAVEADTDPLGNHLEAAAAGLGELLDALQAVDDDLGAVTGPLGLEPPRDERKAG